MLSKSWISVPAAVVVLFASVFTMSLLEAKQSYDARENRLSSWRGDARVIPPLSVPPVSQKSIDTALAMFGIKVPHNAQKPELDTTIEDRGLTSMIGWRQKLVVKIGPAAFESWALLGSTLAHELEVHCRQNFAIIRLKDLAGMNGTLNAEREAYHHELKHAVRFGLSPIERRHIEATMDYYYPATEQGAFSAK